MGITPRHGVRASRAAIALASLLLCATATPAQPSSARDAYLAAVRAYAQTGDAVVSLAEIPGWSPAQFKSAITSLILGAQPIEQATAAVLQLEIALGVAARAPAAATEFLEQGERLILHLRSRPEGRVRADGAAIPAFAGKWYVAAASALLIVNDVRRAQPWVEKGLRYLPDAPELRLQAGIVSEVQALALRPSDVTHVRVRTQMTQQRARLLRAAEADYRRVLAGDPAFVPARIRLGRLLWVRGEIEPARQELSRAAQDARDPSDRYLAAMFVGALLEGQQDLPGAAAAYEEALSHQPASQAAAVAVGHLALITGRAERAQAVAFSFMSTPPGFDEWWAYRRGDQHQPALAWLRAAVRP